MQDGILSLLHSSEKGDDKLLTLSARHIGAMMLSEGIKTRRKIVSRPLDALDPLLTS